MGHMTQRSRAASALFGSLVWAAAPCLAQAQEQEEEIVVTAQRREQALSDVPATINAFTGEQLNNLGVTQTNDLGLLTPNLSIGGAYAGSSNPIITIRGVGLSDFNDNNSSPAGGYVDEVYFVSPPMLAFSLFDVERVEVLKGPQGTLYGRNTTAGALNFISRRPTDQFEAGLRVDGESYDRLLSEVYVSGPLGDRLSGRIAAIGETGGGFINNRVSGREDGDRDYAAGRVLLGWAPTDAIDVLFNLHAGRDRSDLGQYQHAGLLDPTSGGLCAAASAGRTDPTACVDAFGYSDVDGDVDAGDYNKVADVDYDNTGGSVRVDWDLGGPSLTSITAFETFGGLRREDADGSPNGLIEIDYDVDVDQISEELRLSFETDTGDWILGAYYGRDEIDVTNTSDVLRDLRTTLVGSPGVPPSGFLPIGADPAGTFAAQFANAYTQETTAAALFGHVIWRLSEHWNAQTGVRYTSEERAFRTRTRYDEDPAELTGYGLPADGVFLDEARSIDYSDTSWTLGVSYEPTDDHLYYASASRGFKSGGFNGGIPLTPDEVVPYDPETLLAYELGAKITVANGRGQFNASAFYYDYSDLQVFTVVNTGATPVQILTNAANAEIYGLDAEAVIRPLDGLDINLGLGLLSAEYVNANIGGRNRSGETLVNSPELSFNASLRYERPIVGGRAFALLSGRYQSEQTVENEIAPVRQEGYWITDLRLGFGAEDGRWQVAAYAKNLADARPLTGRLTLTDLGFAELTYGQPRRVGISLSIRY
jgi:iron complex outermembrane receptor protein